MTAGELVEELRKLPQHHPIVVDVGLRHNESIQSIKQAPIDAKIGPSIVIYTESDPRNDPEPEIHYYEGEHE